MNPGIATKQGYVLIEFLTGTGENPVPIVGEIGFKKRSLFEFSISFCRP